ncbi:MAG: Gfo/Idh/MocA family oxidoreductase [Tannerellaceae bacterium]|jgi:predicted dehydrogenase|nr:Gfo/Idh/MocA family oxidoreductase [Tannerellaceae bacterium]
MQNTSRRTFIKQTTAAGVALSLGGMNLSARSYANIVGANERIQVAVMGTNGRGAVMAQLFQQAGQANVAYVCDVDEAALAKGVKAVTGAGGSPKTEKDIRKLLADKNLDALYYATPDHWHAAAAVMACQAGKHVYGEKPCGHNPREGELMTAAARKYNRIVQIGAQRRSWPGVIEAIRELQGGAIGKAYFARGWYTNRRSSIGTGKTAQPPSGLDFDLWQGPAPRRSFRDNLVHYNWHWFWHWGTGEALNNGTHEIDLIRWGLGVDYPTQVSSEGARFAFKDDWECPDTQIINLQFGNDCLVTWEGRSCNGRHSEGADRGVVFYGSEGSLETGHNGYRIFDRQNKLVREVSSKDVIDGTNAASPAARLDAIHIADFLDAVRNNRRPSADVAELHKSTVLVQLGNIAWRTGERLAIDPSDGHILNSTGAQALWSRSYEPGWEISV